MARPIKETPVIRGEDARRFVENNKLVNKVSLETKKRMEDNYNALKSIASF